MIIQEKDFNITKDDKCYVLHVIKNRKEVKEDDQSLFKVYGYYTNPLSALKGALRFRRDKKYPGKELASNLISSIRIYEESQERLNKLGNNIYSPILELKKEYGL